MAVAAATLVQERIAGVLRRLLRKKDVLPSTALIIPWRPFYDLLSSLYFGKLRSSIEIHKQYVGSAHCCHPRHTCTPP